MQTVTVDLGANSYPIHIGKEIVSDATLIRPWIHGSGVFVVTDSNVAPLYLQSLLQVLSFTAVDHMVLPAGERYKTLATMETIFDAMLKVPCDRTTTLVALGGGVVGDIAGFAAACYQRGICFIQVPTTLLAQVDSSVGGKTGVNHELGKNMLGAFYQPQGVLIDIGTLHSLDRRQILAGIAEIIKYGVIYDIDFFQWLESNIDNVIKLDENTLVYAIKRSCEIKAEIVSQDERESGLRAILNFGHTFGHAIETILGYGTWLHGEAVAAGMVLAARLSVELGTISEDDETRIENLLDHVGLPVALPDNIRNTQMLDCMTLDKKVVGGSRRLVLLQGLGQSHVADDIPTDTICRVLRRTRTSVGHRIIEG